MSLVGSFFGHCLRPPYNSVAHKAIYIRETLSRYRKKLANVLGGPKICISEPFSTPFSIVWQSEVGSIDWAPRNHAYRRGHCWLVRLEQGNEWPGPQKRVDISKLANTSESKSRSLTLYLELLVHAYKARECSSSNQVSFFNSDFPPPFFSFRAPNRVRQCGSGVGLYATGLPTPKTVPLSGFQYYLLAFETLVYSFPHSSCFSFHVWLPIWRGPWTFS